MSNALDISEKTDLTLRDGLQSKVSNISYVMASNWFIHESDGWNPGWFGFSGFSSNKKLYILVKIISWNIFPKMGKREPELFLVHVFM